MNTDQQELAACQRAIEAAKDEIAAWKRHADQAERDAAQYRRCLEVVVHFWRNDPLAFGDDATPTTLAGRFATLAHICEGALETVGAGAALLAELEAARALVVALDTIDHQPVGACESDFGGMPEPCESCVEMREIAKQALAAYATAVKANKQ